MGRFWEIVGPMTGGMRAPAAPDAPRYRVAMVGDDGTVVGDFPCHHCGYDLRTLHVGGNCPECGTPIRASMRGNILLFSDPAWLKHVALGVRWMGKFGLIALVLSLVWLYAQATAMGGLVAFGVLVTLVLFLAGTWMATTQDPSGIDDERCGKYSQAARWLLGAGLLAAPWGAVHEHIPLPHGLTRSITGLLLAAGFVGILATVRYFQRLTLRIPDGRLFAALESYFRFLLIMTTLATLAAWIMNLMENPPTWVRPPLTCVLVAPLLLLSFSTFNYLSICSDLAHHLELQAKKAEKIWPMSE